MGTMVWPDDECRLCRQRLAGTALTAHCPSKCGRLRFVLRPPSDWGAYASRVLVVASRDDELSDLEARESETPSPTPETGALPGTARAVSKYRDATRRGANPCTASASARMCSGVVPQQPPTTFSQPFLAHLETFGAKVSGVSGKPVGESGSGSPAFGYALM